MPGWHETCAHRGRAPRLNRNRKGYGPGVSSRTTLARAPTSVRNTSRNPATWNAHSDARTRRTRRAAPGNDGAGGPAHHQLAWHSPPLLGADAWLERASPFTGHARQRDTGAGGLKPGPGIPRAPWWPGITGAHTPRQRPAPGARPPARRQQPPQRRRFPLGSATRASADSSFKMSLNSHVVVRYGTISGARVPEMAFERTPCGRCVSRCPAGIATVAWLCGLTRPGAGGGVVHSRVVSSFFPAAPLSLWPLASAGHSSGVRKERTR